MSLSSLSIHTYIHVSGSSHSHAHSSPLTEYILSNANRLRPLPSGFLGNLVLHCHEETDKDDDVVKKV